MREIKFRGKRKDNNEWIYGSLWIRREADTSWLKCYICEKFDDEWHEIIPETVGQFIDLKIKNVKEIYEGDEVKCSISKTQHYKGYVLYEDGHFYIQTFWYRFRPTGRWDLQKPPLSGRCNTKLDIRNTINEVIGTIHDNPEILEK